LHDGYTDKVSNTVHVFIATQLATLCIDRLCSGVSAYATREKVTVSYASIRIKLFLGKYCCVRAGWWNNWRAFVFAGIEIGLGDSVEIEATD
jgi:hypothetical protein